MLDCYRRLHPWNVYRLRAKLAAGERVYPAGFEFVFHHAIAHPEQDDSVEVHGAAAHSGEPVALQLTRTQARECIEDTGRQQLAPPRPPDPWQPAPDPPQDRLDLVVWLAGHNRFDEAARVLYGDPDSRSPREDGEALLRAAQYFHARAANRDAARWLADHSLNGFHSWMSNASSGGEGTAMQYEIRSQLEAARKLLY